MPIYEYQCERCGTVTDIKHGFKEPMNEACSKCAGALKRLFNPASIVFKGSGFYVNDSRKAAGGNGKGGASKDDSAPGDASKEAAVKADSTTGDAAKSDPPRAILPRAS